VTDLIVSHAPTPDQKRIRVLRFVIVLLACVTQFISLSLCVYFVKHSADTDRQIAKLTLERAATVDCSSAFSRQITAASQAYISSLGAVVLSYFETTADTPERDRVVAAGVAKVRSVDVAYRTAVTEQAAYINAGSPLPCPIKETP
jgi:hypothetical protein